MNKLSTWIAIDGLLRTVNETFALEARRFGLTVIEFLILVALLSKEGQHATDLAAAVGRAATSFTSNLDAMVEKGLIERQPDRLDRRAILLYLTPQGQGMRETVTEAFARAEAEARRTADEWRHSYDEAEGVALSGFVVQRG